MYNLRWKVKLVDVHGQEMGEARPWALGQDRMWELADVKMDQDHVSSVRVTFTDGSYMEMIKESNFEAVR